MKKYIHLVIFASLFITNMSFTVAAAGKKKAAKSKITAIKKQNCTTCPTPANFISTSSGGYTTFRWDAVPGAVTYSFGGYYRTASSFTYCTTNTYITIPTNGGGTVQMRVICKGDCTSNTCSSNTKGPITF